MPLACSVFPSVLCLPPRQQSRRKFRLAAFVPISKALEIPSVLNAPFTAKVVTWNEPQVGGDTVSRKYYTVVARDSQGRVRREIREFIPADSTRKPPLRSFTILDPVAATRTTCTTATMNCATTPFHVPWLRRMLVAAGSGNSRESLGQQTIDDLPVVGTRQTVSSSSGTPHCLSRTDVWYSPDLHMDLSISAAIRS